MHIRPSFASCCRPCSARSSRLRLSPLAPGCNRHRAAGHGHHPAGGLHHRPNGPACSVIATSSSTGWHPPARRWWLRTAIFRAPRRMLYELLVTRGAGRCRLVLRIKHFAPGAGPGRAASRRASRSTTALVEGRRPDGRLRGDGREPRTASPSRASPPTPSTSSWNAVGKDGQPSQDRVSVHAREVRPGTGNRQPATGKGPGDPGIGKLRPASGTRDRGTAIPRSPITTRPAAVPRRWPAGLDNPPTREYIRCARKYSPTAEATHAQAATVDLTRRESQIMEILYRRRRATVEDIRAELPDAPSPSSVRKLLDIMIERGLLGREYDGPRYRLLPRRQAGRRQPLGAQQLVRTFFDNSPGSAMAALLDMSDDAAVRRRATAAERAARARTRTGDASDELPFDSTSRLECRLLLPSRSAAGAAARPLSAGAVHRRPRASGLDAGMAACWCCRSLSSRCRTWSVESPVGAARRSRRGASDAAAPRATRRRLPAGTRRVRAR